MWYPADNTLQLYHEKYKKEQLIIPKFQRAYVWDLSRASKLIESFLSGLPVPAVFLYQERKSKNLLVIDGHQRIMTAIRFFEERFGERAFRLKNVSSRWEGKAFSDLAKPDQNELMDTVLRAIIVQQLDPSDDTSIYKIFARLNTGGMNLNAMEIRKCLDHGEYYDLLEELNLHGAWREIIGLTQPDKRLKDVELILRYLALEEEGEYYVKPMKGFLDNFLKRKKREATQTEMNIARERFKRTTTFVCENLGPKPFHLRGRLNYAVMDSTMVFATRAAEMAIAGFSGRYAMLKDNPEYIECVTKNTSDENTVRQRFDIARRTLLE